MSGLQNMILFLYDLPKDTTTHVKILNTIQTLTGYDLNDLPRIKRELGKPFYTAEVVIYDTQKFDEIRQKLKYFKFENCECRALPYLKELYFPEKIKNFKSNNLLI